MDPVVTHIVDIALYILIEFYAYTLFYIHFTACVFMRCTLSEMTDKDAQSYN